MFLCMQDESGLSGTLNLGHYGVSQSNSFEALNINPAATEVITPFAKLSVPYKVCSACLSVSAWPACMRASCTFHVNCARQLFCSASSTSLDCHSFFQALNTLFLLNTAGLGSCQPASGLTGSWTSRLCMEGPCACACLGLSESCDAPQEFPSHVLVVGLGLPMMKVVHVCAGVHIGGSSAAADPRAAGAADQGVPGAEQR